MLENILITGIFKTGKTSIAKALSSEKKKIYIPQPFHNKKLTDVVALANYYHNYEDISPYIVGNLNRHLNSYNLKINNRKITPAGIRGVMKYKIIRRNTGVILDDPFITYCAHNVADKLELQLCYVIREPNEFMEDCMRRKMVLHKDKMLRNNVIKNNEYISWSSAVELKKSSTKKYQLMLIAYYNHLLWLNKYRPLLVFNFSDSSQRNNIKPDSFNKGVLGGVNLIKSFYFCDLYYVYKKLSNL